MTAAADQLLTVRYSNVVCQWCGEPMPPGTTMLARRRKPYHPGCWATARKEQLTPPPF